MATDTLSKESQLAVEHFERKLNFEVGPVGLDRILKAKEPVQIIDLRTADFYGKGHVPSATNVLYEQLEAHTSKLNKDVPVVVYCYDAVCHLAAKGALLLAKKGFKVKELVGGYDEWTKHNNQVEMTKAGGSCCGG